uniref:MICOS complex subunit n=1 Tax=Mola mola TaxID=94237 RepID=A0A3Q3W7E1_MOLML
ILLQVAIVAVPTVLGIASIRVYTVREEPIDGLVPREKLNIYTPMPQCAEAQFVPERAGVIQNGLTAARESILPVVQTVKDTCSSVKRGSVKLYYTGEDVFYYLKDPPPEFLPRFGTITMAGLLGMFMARKGSRFKRLAVPLGLMSAGASVCYPAHAVAVAKVTGKKAYAAGQWSRAALSSLLTPKPQQPVYKEPVSSQQQAATVPNPESAVAEEASEACTTTGMVSAEFVPFSDEPVVTVVAEEASSAALVEISPAQTPDSTDDFLYSLSSSDPDSASAGTKNVEEIHAPVEGEEPSDTKQAAEDVSTHASPAVSTPSSEPESVESAPAESVPAPKVSDELSGTRHYSSPKCQQSRDSLSGGSGFKSDSALMDFGQSSPEDEDLYSTRS